MPSTKKRVNLTIPDNVYERLQAYMKRNGIANDATACLQLVVQQLNSFENTATLLDFIQRSNMEQLMEVSREGFEAMKQLKMPAPQKLPDSDG
ncbi:MAG: hypothetical protein J6J63_04390 [Oscillospiraceae bacterium]|nr:hypothetical protein [Oscillospiraceae bacterium]